MSDPLDPEQPVLVAYDAPDLEYLLEHWRHRDTAARLRRVLTAADLERAQRPPVVHVTLPGIGRLTKVAGAGGVAFTPDSLA